jgi:hypothetical protein
MESEWSDADSDEWAQEELLLPAIIIPTHHTNNYRHDGITSTSNSEQIFDETDLQQQDDYWDVPTATTAMISKDDTTSQTTTTKGTRTTPVRQEDDDNQGGYPMLLVNLTRLSDGVIHSKFDVNSVNDPAAVKEWRRTVERNFDTYASDASMLVNRIVIPCGSTVWRTALQNLRREEPGIYYCPIFPPVSPKDAQPLS